MRTLIVFIAVAALSVLASNQRLLQAGRFFNLAQLAASGLLFLVLGAALGPGGLNVVYAEEVLQARPLLALGLGFAGLLVGMNLEPQLLRALPARVWAAAATQSGFASLAVFAPIGALIVFTSGFDLTVALGAAAILASAASVSSSHFAVLWYRSGKLDRLRGLSVSLIAMLDDLMGIAVLAVALILGAHATVGLGAGLVTLAMLLGMVCGALTAFLLHRSEGAESTAVLLGAVGLVSGAAAFLKVSALIAGLACGFTLAVIGGSKIANAYKAIARVERPLYLVLLVLIGAHVSVRDAYAWAILPAFVALRVAGKIAGGRVATRVAGNTLHLPKDVGYALIGQGGLSLCVLIEYLVLVGGRSAQIVFDVGVVAAILNEILGSRTFRRALHAPEVARPHGAVGEGA